MPGNIPHWAEFLFGGVGGTALLGLTGFAYHRWRSAKDPKPTSKTIAVSTAVGDVESKDKSVALGSGASLQGSPIVYGSHNVFNFPHHSGEAKPGEAKKEDEIPIWLVILGILVVLVIVAGAIYLSTRYSTPTPKPAVSALTQQTTPATGAPVSQAKSTYLIGIQYGRDISSISVDGDEYTTCTEEGITCLGEKAISGKTISIPLQNGSKWSRIAVLISSTEYVEFARIVVSTQSDVIGLNYVEHRDGMFHNQIEFSKQFVYPISESQKPLWYPIDITFRKPIEKFPLTITVSANDQPAHSVTTYLQVPLPSSPSAQKANPTLPLSGHSQTLTPAPERNITIADRVTVIIAHRLHLKAGGVKSEDDFEVDLGASPTDVKLIMYDLQDEYGISIPKSDALKIKTVGEAIKYVEQRDKQ